MSRAMYSCGGCGCVCVLKFDVRPDLRLPPDTGPVCNLCKDHDTEKDGREMDLIGVVNDDNTITPIAIPS